MKVDIRQIRDLVDEAGFIQVEKGRPQSKANWSVDSVYEFENAFKRLDLTFTIDPLPDYLTPRNRRSKGKAKQENTLDEVQIRMTDKNTGEVNEWEFDLRNSSQEDFLRLKRFITLYD